MKRFLIGAGVLFVIACLWHRLSIAPRAHQSLHTTARQILDQSEPICEALAPPGVSLQMAAELAPGTEEVRPIWNVECTDRYGQDMVNLRWSADTGRLLSAGTQYPLSRAKKLKLTTASQARDTAWFWLKRLGLVENASRWHLDRPVAMPAQATWIVQCRAFRQQMLLDLDARSGKPHYLLADGYLDVLPIRKH